MRPARRRPRRHGADAERLAGKVARLRIFENDEGKFDRSLLDTGGAALVVSQFTLLADTAKGNRPSFSDAAPPEEAEPLYEAFCVALARARRRGGDRRLRRADGGRARQRRPGHDRSSGRECRFSASSIVSISTDEFPRAAESDSAIESSRPGGEAMARTVVLVGTRKGCFLLESDEARRDWELRGPFCEGWPVYHAIHDPGSGVDLRGRGERVARLGGLAEPRPGRDVGALERGPRLRGRRREEDVEGLEPGREERPHSRRRRDAGIFESTDGGETWSLLTTLAGQPGSEALGRPCEPAARPPRHLGDHVRPRGGRPRFWAIVQGVGLFETEDDAKTWTPRNKGLRADWPREHEEVGFCVHKLVRSPVDGDRMYQQNHVGMHRSDDCGQTWTEITEGLPTEFGFAAATHPHDRETFYVIPLDPGHGRTMPDGHAAVWRTRDAGESWQRLDTGLPPTDA